MKKQQIYSWRRKRWTSIYDIKVD